MKKTFLILLVFFSFSFSPNSFAQKVVIDQIRKNNEAGEAKGCGVEMVITDGEARGVQMQAILYSLGNLNWDLTMHMVAGSYDENREFVQENIINASILSEKIGEVKIIRQGKNTSQEFTENQNKISIIPHMLFSGFELSYQTESKPDGFIKIPAFEDKYKEYNEGCFAQIKEKLKEEYKKHHGDTKCIDDPSSC